MTTAPDKTPTTTALRVVASRILLPRTTRSPRVLTATYALALGRFIMKPVRSLFPAPAGDGALRLVPGAAAQFDLAISAPGRRLVHLYAEPATISGSARLTVTQAQAVRLSEDGQATVQLRAEPQDDRETGLCRLRIAAVDPNSPEEIAAEIPDLRVTVEGSGDIVKRVVAGAFVTGMLLQTVFTSLPIVGLLIAAALIFAAINTPTGTDAGFRPMALLAPRRRLGVAAAALAGIFGFLLFMHFNQGNGSAADPYCDEWGQPACTAIEVVGDNLTALAANLILFGLVFLSLSPAFRPRRLAGYAFALSVAVCFMVYDLTLLGTSGATRVEEFFPIDGRYSLPCAMSPSKRQEINVFPNGRIVLTKPFCDGDLASLDPTGGDERTSRSFGLSAPVGPDSFGIRLVEYNVEFRSEGNARVLNMISINYRMTGLPPGVRSTGSFDARLDGENGFARLEDASGTPHRESVYQGSQRWPWLFGGSKAYAYGYGVFGWGAALLALAALAAHQRVRRALMIAGATAAAGLSILAAMSLAPLGLLSQTPQNQVYSFMPEIILLAPSAFIGLVALLAHATLLPIGKRPRLRALIFGVVTGAVFQGLIWQPVLPALGLLIVMVFAVAWCLIEIGIWNYRRRRRRTVRQGAARQGAARQGAARQAQAAAPEPVEAGTAPALPSGGP
ncbi:MAG: hypothetical protein KF914_17405 [Rhizobiaceae bacterium]|nr:hypothetical protein [Rhizobiaceae bacterium]